MVAMLGWFQRRNRASLPYGLLAGLRQIPHYPEREDVRAAIGHSSRQTSNPFDPLCPLRGLIDPTTLAASRPPSYSLRMRGPHSAKQKTELRTFEPSFRIERIALRNCIHHAVACLGLKTP